MQHFHVNWITNDDWISNYLVVGKTALRSLHCSSFELQKFIQCLVNNMTWVISFWCLDVVTLLENFLPMIRKWLKNEMTKKNTVSRLYQLLLIRLLTASD